MKYEPGPAQGFFQIKEFSLATVACLGGRVLKCSETILIGKKCYIIKVEWNRMLKPFERKAMNVYWLNLSF